MSHYKGKALAQYHGPFLCGKSQPSQAYPSHTTHCQHLLQHIDMIILAYFFLLQPGEYTDNDGDTDKHPFLLEDVQLFIGDTRLNLMTDLTLASSKPDLHPSLSPLRKMGCKGKSLDWSSM